MRVKAIGLDVDGTLTDAAFYWGDNGEELKRFSFLDVMGISMAKNRGVVFALISGENSPLVDRFAQKMGIEDVYKGCKEKGGAFKDFLAKRGFSQKEACFMGDDVNDLPAMNVAGFSAAPANAVQAVRDHVDLVTYASGGNGAVRELVDYLAVCELEVAAAS